MPTQAKPTIRIIHNLARSGGTLIAKCLGSMQNTALLSEIHPDSQMALSFNATRQAQDWLGLDKSIDWQQISFIESLKIIQTHCQLNNQKLLLRDWSHIDYFGVPVTTEPKNIPVLLEVLRPYFHILSIQTLRNPLDIWLSMRRLSLVRKANINASDFMNAYLRYVQNTQSDYQLLYEHFLDNPDQELKNTCKALDLSYDSTYKKKWFNYSTITGDLSNSSSLRNETDIESRPRKEFDRQVLVELKSSSAYAKVMKLIPAYDTF